MPQFGTFSPAEVEELTKRRAPVVDLSAYVEHLKSLKPGEWGHVSPGPDETQRLVKRRLNQAAKQIDVSLKYKKRKGEERIVFQKQ